MSGCFTKSETSESAMMIDGYRFFICFTVESAIFNQLYINN